MNRIKTILTNPALRLRTIGTALFPIFFVLPAPVALAAEANLTRFGPEVYELVQGKPTTYSARFKAVDGPAQLVLQDEGIENAWIEVNGSSVVERQHFSGNGEVVIALNLQQENTIEDRTFSSQASFCNFSCSSEPTRQCLDWWWRWNWACGRNEQTNFFL